VRPAARLAIAALSTLALVLPLAGSAVADPKGPTLPSAERVEKAKRDVEEKKRSVAELQAALEASNARLEEAVIQAGYLAEQYNGAVWRLSEARKAKKQAEQDEADAIEAVRNQRRAIITLVTESYQNGTELNTATALVGEGGPEGLMNRYAVVQSAGDSMEAAHARYRQASARAKEARSKAVGAEKKQEELAEEARRLRDEAGQAAAAAALATNQIAAQREELVEALAKAEDISYELASKRQKGLERIAEQKAAELARARKEAEEAALKKARDEARKAREEAKDAGKGVKKPKRDRTGSQSPATGGAYVRPVDYTPRAPGRGAKAAVNYAKMQLGKPYVWAAAGPNAFDCSGLTMRAWQAGGKMLPHFSGAQYEMGTRIPVPLAAAGDLYFWTNNGRPSGIHHVALALGDGRFIEAPRTGLAVRYNHVSNWYPDYAVRP
jgi:cell wall-associated NlpC family hydrolase